MLKPENWNGGKTDQIIAFGALGFISQIKKVFLGVTIRSGFNPWSPEVEPWVFRWTFYFSSSSSSSAPPPIHLQLLFWGVGGGGGYTTVDHGSCAEYALLFV